MRGLLAVSVAGAIIVAGPWLVTSIALALVSIVLGDTTSGFFAFIVYSYASSLVFMGGYHYYFTRVVADLLYVKNYSAIRTELFRARLIALAGGAAIGAVLGAVTGLGAPAIFAAAAVSLAWIEMMAVSLLRRFGVILVGYLAGAVVLVGGSFLLPDSAGTGSVILLFAAAHVVTLGILVVVTATFLRTKKTSSGTGDVSPATYMWAIGTLLYAIMWFDKVLYWFTFGSPGVIGLPLFDTYDKSTFVAQLTLIPTMIHFAVRGETSFLRGIQEVVRALRHRPYGAVQRAKFRLISGNSFRLTQQLALQFLTIVLTLVLLPVFEKLIGDGGTGAGSGGTLIRAVLASHAYLLLYTIVVDLLYISDHRSALRVLMVAMALVVVLSVLTALFGLHESTGISLVVGCLVSAVYAQYRLSRSSEDLDRTILTASL